jgi:hypothetical protein
MQRKRRERERAGYGASYENERRESETCVRDNALRGLIRSSSEGGGGGLKRDALHHLQGFGFRFEHSYFRVWGLGFREV